MSAENTVTFYLPPALRTQAERGNHNFINKVAEVLTSGGVTIAFDTDDDAARKRADARPGRGLFLTKDPVNTRSLMFQKTYIYPFWRIEQQANSWEWPVAQEVFDPAKKDQRKADNFYRFWQNRLFEGKVRLDGSDGFVYVPLQGQLTERQPHQFCSPIDMVKAVLQHDRQRHVIATLDASETYSTEEQAALEKLIADNDRLFVSTDAVHQYLQNCDYIAAQNTKAGFMGYFCGKPLILFAKADFHHIALNAGTMGVTEAFSAVGDHRPDYAAYLHWFLQLRSINAGRPEAATKIRTVLRRYMWPV